MAKRKVHQFRHYVLSGRRQLGKANLFRMSLIASNLLVFTAEIDICLLTPYGGYIGLLLLIDAYTKFLWFGLLKSKKKTEVFGALNKIIKQSGQFSRVISDGELSFCLSWFQERNIYYHSVPLSKHARCILIY